MDSVDSGRRGGMGWYSVALFDLDGTLTDSQVGITKGIRYALARYGIETPELATLRPLIGPPLAQSFQRIYGFDEEQARQAVATYRVYFAETGIYENAVYAGIPELLARLRAQGMTLLLATAKLTVYAERILRHFRLDGYFAGVYGSDLTGALDSKTAVIAQALAGLPLAAREAAVMVGDREDDVIGARVAGIASIAVTYGYGALAELEAAQPTAIARSVAELEALLTR